MPTIKDQIEAGEYRVDCWLVADAIIRRMRAGAGEVRAGAGGAGEVRAIAAGERRARGEPQKVCSKPDSSVLASRKATPGGPETTEPIHVIPALAPRHC